MSTTTDGAREKGAGRTLARRLPVGVEVVGDHIIHARVWAPTAHDLEIVLEGRAVALVRDANGYFSGETEGRAGDRYGFRVNGSERLYPDPASRFQPEGPHDLSEIVDPNAFRWTDRAWSGVSLAGQVLYELHQARSPAGDVAGGCGAVGGTGDARHHRHRGDAGRRIRRPVRLGLRRRRSVRADAPLRPARRFPARSSTARTRSGSASSSTSSTTISVRTATTCARSRRPTSPTATRTSGATRSISTAPTPGRCASSSSPTPATGSTSFTSTACGSTRRSRSSTPRRHNVMAAIGDRVREKARGRQTIIVAENEPQDTRLVRPVAAGRLRPRRAVERRFHHSAMVALTGRAEAYYSDTRGDAAGVRLGGEVRLPVSGPVLPLAAASRAARRRWTFRPASFVVFLQNHDQVANSARGLRGHQLTSPAKWRAMTALLLLVPGTPMLFQGRNSRRPAPFLYFADHDAELAAAVETGRAEFLRQFPSIAITPRTGLWTIPATIGRSSAASSTSPSARRNAAVYALHRDLLALRRTARRSAPSARAASTAPCSRRSAFVAPVLHRRPSTTIRLLIVNLGPRPEAGVDRRAADGAAGRSRLERGVVQRGSAVRRRGHART